MQLSEKIIADLNLPDSLVKEALVYAQSRVKKFHLPKNSGGHRVISQPSNKLKSIQYWLINNVFSQLGISDYATAYRDGWSTYKNVEAHVKNNYFLKIDLEDFFPSIKYDDFLPIVEAWYKENPQLWAFNQQAKLIIFLACFDKNHCLPIGYPTSPIISNIVMNDFDNNVVDALKDQSKYGRVIYTRYADDMVFSTDMQGACNEIFGLVKNVVKKMKSPDIKINSKKVRFSSKSGGSAFVTGLRICEKNHITIHKKYKDRIRLLLSLYEKEKLREEDFETLKGHISYIKYVDAAFYTKIQKRYFKSIHNLFSCGK